MPTLLDLPREIMVDITGLCITADVNTLCRTCRALNLACTPQLYETIDLSSHNSSIECEPNRYIPSKTCMVPLDFVERHCTEVDIAVLQRQDLLLRTFAANDSYGSYVRTLRWTIMNLEDWDSGRGFPMFPEDDAGYSNSEEIPDSALLEDEPLWAMFRSFSRVSSVDLCWLRDWREITSPGPLFPSLSSLRLSGCMSLEFVSCVLNSQIEYREQRRSLRNLDLNNLFEWSKIEPPPPRFSHVRDLAHYVESNADSLKILEAAPMLGHIGPLIDQLGNLRILRIGTVGLTENDLPNPHANSVYSSWARLLRAVRPTLEEFNFDQGYNRNDNIQAMQERHRPANPPQPIPTHRQMDELFVKNILPALLEAPWPRMKCMHIRGVGHSALGYYRNSRPTKEQLLPADLWKVTEQWEGETRCYYVEKTVIAVPLQEREQLRELLGGGHLTSVEFVFEEEQGRDWEYPLYGGLGWSAALIDRCQ